MASRIGGNIRGGPQGLKIGCEGCLAGCVEAAEGHLRGAEVFPEKCDGSCGTEGKFEINGNQFGLDICEVRGKPRANGSLVAPKHRWRDARAEAAHGCCLL